MTQTHLTKLAFGTLALATLAGTLLAGSGGGSHGSAPAHSPAAPAAKPAMTSTPATTAKPAATTPTTPTAPTHTAAAMPGSYKAPAAAELALTILRDGNSRFISGTTSGPNRDALRVKSVASGQEPFATILTCADSRVAPELLFDRGIGELFIIRVAGNVADGDEIGTIEYGAGHLNTPLIVVMGHSKCGAVKAVCSGATVHGSIPGLVDNIIPAYEFVKEQYPDLKDEALVKAVIQQNVWQSIDDLFTRSDEVRELVMNGKAMVVGAVYDLDTGAVQWLGRHPAEGEILAGAPSTGHGKAHANAPATTQTPKQPAPAAKTADAHDNHGDAHPHR